MKSNKKFSEYIKEAKSTESIDEGFLDTAMEKLIDMFAKTKLGEDMVARITHAIMNNKEVLSKVFDNIKKEILKDK